MATVIITSNGKFYVKQETSLVKTILEGKMPNNQAGKFKQFTDANHHKPIYIDPSKVEAFFPYE